MALCKLNPGERRVLRQVARSSPNAREVRRAQALVWLSSGESVAQVAHRLGLSRQGIYQWVVRYRSRRRGRVRARVGDRPHTGRPPHKLKLVVRVIRPLLSRDPRRYGYRAMIWTVPMLRRQVKRRTGTKVSLYTVRRGLHVLRQRYKRPRYVQARRSPTWRQAKGGLNTA
jgi:transposase